MAIFLRDEDSHLPAPHDIPRAHQFSGADPAPEGTTRGEAHIHLAGKSLTKPCKPGGIDLDFFVFLTPFNFYAQLPIIR
jgi:hypothetical protein